MQHLNFRSWKQMFKCCIWDLRWCIWDFRYNMPPNTPQLPPKYPPNIPQIPPPQYPPNNPQHTPKYPPNLGGFLQWMHSINLKCGIWNSNVKPNLLHVASEIWNFKFTWPWGPCFWMKKTSIMMHFYWHVYINHTFHHGRIMWPLSQVFCPKPYKL